LSFGPVPAALLTGVGRMIGSRMRGNDAAESVRAASRSMLVVALAGRVYADQGGAFGPGLASGTVRFAPIFLGMAAFAIAEAILRVWRLLAEQPGVSAGMVVSDVQRRVLLDLFVLPLGLGFAWLEALAGPVAAASALMPMLLARRFEGESAPRRTEPGAGSESRLATVRALMAVIDAFDPFTRGHSFRVSKYAVGVARHLGVAGAELEEIEYGALLHDIGRTAIHLDVWTSARPLDARERTVLQTHPTVGYDIVKTLPHMQGAAEIVYAHHEQPDGHGYPRGLEAAQIPLGARIVSVAAAFDAMTRDRPYRRGLPDPAAYEELRRHAGDQFFHDVVEAFIALHEARELDNELDERYEPVQPPAGDGAAAGGTASEGGSTESAA
jgi:putative nucleotidyltransferase with HDIG domain